MWPTEKEGFSDPQETAVKTDQDVLMVLEAEETRLQWETVLGALTDVVEAQGRRGIPGIDHGRVDFFCKEWTADSSARHGRTAAASFAAASRLPHCRAMRAVCAAGQDLTRAWPPFHSVVQRFADAWSAAASGDGHAAQARGGRCATADDGTTPSIRKFFAPKI